MEERVGSHFLFYIFLGSGLFSQKPKGHLPSFLLEHFLNLKSGCCCNSVVVYLSSMTLIPNNKFFFLSLFLS